MNRWLFSVGIGLLLIGSGCAVADQKTSMSPVRPVQDQTPPAATTTTSAPQPVAPELVETEPVLVSTDKPEQPAVQPNEVTTVKNYTVSFTSQAPFAVWDELHGEACEEASLIMAMAYFRDFVLTPHAAEQEILNLINWETDNGYQVDLTGAETKAVAEQYYNLTAELMYEVSADRIKKELDAGRLVILPLAGREIGNPYFQTPGPIYHMLVVVGYDEDEFITNDPGTKRGEGYRYKYAALLNAVHDWDHKLAEEGMTDGEMEQGKKVMIVISK